MRQSALAKTYYRVCCQVLKGVGAKLADRIVEYREKQVELSGLSAFAEVLRLVLP